MGFSVIVENFVNVVVETGSIMGFSVTITVFNREGTSVLEMVIELSGWLSMQEQLLVLVIAVMVSVNIVTDLVDVLVRVVVSSRSALVKVVVSSCGDVVVRVFFDRVIMLVIGIPKTISVVVSRLVSGSVDVGCISVNSSKLSVLIGVSTMMELGIGPGNSLTSLSLPREASRARVIKVNTGLSSDLLAEQDVVLRVISLVIVTVTSSMLVSVFGILSDTSYVIIVGNLNCVDVITDVTVTDLVIEDVTVDTIDVIRFVSVDAALVKVDIIVEGLFVIVLVKVLVITTVDNSNPDPSISEVRIIVDIITGGVSVTVDTITDGFNFNVFVDVTVEAVSVNVLVTGDWTEVNVVEIVLVLVIFSAVFICVVVDGGKVFITVVVEGAP